jgi:hypothetical protein
VVTFPGTLSGSGAQEFFEHLGTIDAALFSGQFAGFTQIDLAGSLMNNSMLFLQPAVSKNRSSRVFLRRRSLPSCNHLSRTTASRRRRGRASRFQATIGWRFRMEISTWRTLADRLSY